MNDEIDLNEAISDDSKNVLKLDSAPFDLPLRVSSFASEKELFTFVKNVEKLVRSSIEYKYWVSYIEENLGQNECALTKEKLTECKLEVHHHPISLFVICKAVTNDFIGKEKKFSTFDIATKIIEMHYQNNVGYIVLLSDLHKKYHDGFQKLPIEFVNGDYKFLLENYNVEEEERVRIYDLSNIHVDDCRISWQKDNYPGIEEHCQVYKQEITSGIVKKISDGG